MEGLEPSDIHLLNAALGWLGLDCPGEAHAELNAITPEAQTHPAVLETRWTLAVREERWDDARVIAQMEIRLRPEAAAGWLHNAYAVRRSDSGGLIMAWGALLPVADKFPKEPVIPFNLSCYACQLKEMEAARIWLKRAMDVGDREAIKKMALADEDLKPLWPEISQL